MFVKGITAIGSGLKEGRGVEFGIKDDRSGFQGLVGTTHRFWLCFGEREKREKEMGVREEEGKRGIFINEIWKRDE